MVSKRHIGGIRVAKVTPPGVYLVGGALKTPVVDVLDSYGGFYRACRILVPGAAGGFDYAPPAAVNLENDYAIQAGPEVVIAFGDGSRPHPVVLGGLPVPELTAARLVDGSSATGDDGDTLDASGTGDRVIEFPGPPGAVVRWTAEGELHLESRHRNQPIKMSVGVDKFIRATHGPTIEGDVARSYPATERLLLATSYTNWLRSEVLSKIDAVAQDLRRLVEALTASTLNNSTPPTFITGMGLALADLQRTVQSQSPPTGLSALGLYETIRDPGGGAAAATGWAPAGQDWEAVQSALFRVSTKSEAD